MGSAPCSSLSLQTRHTRDSMAAVSPEGVEWSSESAVLSCSGDGWDSESKERRREGDRDSLLMGVCIRSGTGAGSSSNQQLLAQSQAQQGGRLASPWGSSWITGPWGGT